MKKAFLTLILITFMPFSAQAGVMEFFFPHLKKKEPDPAQTLVAPFALDGTIEPGKKIDLPTNAVPLNQPHRLSADMTDWIATQTIEALNFFNGNHTAQLEQNRAIFDAFGYGQYQAFLEKNQILKTLQSGQYKIRTYNENVPLLMNEGEVDGRYRWLYRVPVIISYLDAKANGYENAKATNHRATIDIQIGRSKDASNEEGVLMERWSGKIEAVE
ncbi:MAG: DotI/IcmL/TraM family protein [Alphaproteobacteria bacterium]